MMYKFLAAPWPSERALTETVYSLSPVAEPALVVLGTIALSGGTTEGVILISREVQIDADGAFALTTAQS